jgi:branched-chain amino acid aminotransferase
MSTPRTLRSARFDQISSSPHGIFEIEKFRLTVRRLWRFHFHTANCKDSEMTGSPASSGAKLFWPPYRADVPERPSETQFAAGTAYVDGEIVPIEEARIPLLDWGFLRSDACQETISVWDGAFFRLEDHLVRFQRSTDRLRMALALTSDDIRGVAHALVAAAGFRNAYVQIIATRGRPPIGSRDLRLCVNRFQAFCMPYVWIAPPHGQETGISLHISERVRVPSQSVDPMVKHYHWLDFEMGLFEAYDAGAETVVLVDLDGYVTEGPGFNIFASIDGRLVTPASGMLDGMTRRTTLELCRELGLEVEERNLRPTELRSATEVFLTSTAGGLIPVRSVDGTDVGSGAVGPLTARLHREYWTRRSEGWRGEPVGYAQASRP